MNHEDGIRLALAEARKSEAAGGAPIGAVIIRGEEVIAIGHSMVWPEKDPGSHAEMNCIRAACKKLESLDLADCTLYSNIESCSMCLACAGWANLPRVVFGAHQADIPGNSYELANYHAAEHAQHFTNPMEVIGGVLRAECTEYFRGVHGWQRQAN